ncbi:hypothetical protein PsorP6_005212 [Peronosclerospora sorghi]|uniref:Uncharacterized protein n=1 Tax=Peronosclerospora sorghi TaxID=230839 RepID=A0ACC0W3W6_9STRA|nr:hypothetical protein PsorP6_005212 [Peronosclerospora sorghi]
MKTLFAAITMTLVYVSSLALADQSSDKVTTDMSMTDNMREHDTAELVVPVGIISNTIDAKDNKVLITKSHIVISKSDRLKLAKTIEEMLSTSSETHYSSMRSADNLMDLLTRIAATPDMFTHAAVIISAAKSGNTRDVADHLVALLSVALRSKPASDVMDTTTPIFGSNKVQCLPQQIHQLLLIE